MEVPVRAALSAMVVVSALLVVSSSRAEDARPPVTLAPRLGLALPGSMTPSKVRSTSVGPGLALFVDATVRLHPSFELGPYMHLAVRGFTRPLGADGGGGEDTGTNVLLGAGGAAKLRVPFSEHARGRVGLLVGYDYVHTSLIGETLIGHGLGLGASVELAFDVTERVAIGVQLAFIGQVVGTASLPPEIAARARQDATQPFPFPPAAFLTVGPELAL